MTGGPSAASDRLGVVEWLRPGEHERAERLLEGLQRLGIRHLRTGISWAEAHTAAGHDWYDWLIPRLAREVEVLPCVCYTPPSIGIMEKSSAPPRDPKGYADFLDVLVTRHGRHFDWVELWNEPNNINDWDWRLDPCWLTFAKMAGGAAYWMQRRGKKTVLGGMCPTDPNWLAAIAQLGVLDHIDAVGLHDFPGTWQHDGTGWADLAAQVRRVLAHYGKDCAIWTTETGYSTWRRDEARQLDHLLDALAAPVDRVYWYAYADLDPELPSQEGFHVDERHYHFGLIHHDRTPKLLARALEDGGVDEVRRIAQLRRRTAPAGPPRRRTVITGGAGFVGANLADRLAGAGQDVLIYDNLSRPGVEENLAWLADRHGARIAAEIADVRDPYTLKAAVAHADRLYHLAAQVAVTTSVADPVFDFEVNLRGTMTLLDAVRRRADPPPLVFASTNKVYGALAGVELVDDGSRHGPADPEFAARGIAEDRPLDFYSPYGCSKGGADQYVLDHARIYGLPAAVLRFSCLYGPRQFGTEDQGWVAHFLIRTLRGEPITLFGDGRQVRDVLFVDDAVDAFLAARAEAPRVRGRAFNIGGGPANAVSLLDCLDLIARLTGRRPEVALAPWRPGDQRWYVSDTRAFGAATGWRARVGVEAGIARLAAWLIDRFAPSPAATATAVREDVPA